MLILNNTHIICGTNIIFSQTASVTDKEVSRREFDKASSPANQVGLRSIQKKKKKKAWLCSVFVPCFDIASQLFLLFCHTN